ncbi:hypothetical protein PMAYCL1PPCAC_29701, partial [Pristionchus mayeri]
ISQKTRDISIWSLLLLLNHHFCWFDLLLFQSLLKALRDGANQSRSNATSRGDPLLLPLPPSPLLCFLPCHLPSRQEIFNRSKTTCSLESSSLSSFPLSSLQIPPLTSHIFDVSQSWGRRCLVGVYL